MEIPKTIKEVWDSYGSEVLQNTIPSKNDIRQAFYSGATAGIVTMRGKNYDNVVAAKLQKEIMSWAEKNKQGGNSGENRGYLGNL